MTHSITPHIARAARVTVRQCRIAINSLVCCVFAIASIASVTHAQAAGADALNNPPRVLGECALDVDGDGRILPNDVLMAMRAALGIKGAALVSDITFAGNALRTSDAAVSAFLAGGCGSLNCGLDLDGDTRVRATNDLLAALRIAFRVRDNVALDATVLNGVNFASNAPRNTWNAIRDYLIDCRDVNPNPPLVAGLVYLSAGANAANAAGGIVGLSFLQTASGVVSDATRGVRFAFATYSVSNSTGGPLNQLCLVATNAPGNLAGTAIYALNNFSSANLTANQFARGSKPSHKMNASGSTSVIDANNANLQLLSAADAAFGCSSGTGLSGSVGTTNLEYGFAVSPTTIADGGTGTVTVAYRLPGNNTDQTAVTASFGAFKDGPNRVSQSREETVSQVNARAIARGAAEIAYSGPGAASATPPSGITPIRLTDPNISTGSSPATLYGP